MQNVKSVSPICLRFLFAFIVHICGRAGVGAGVEIIRKVRRYESTENLSVIVSSVATVRAFIEEHKKL